MIFTEEREREREREADNGRVGIAAEALFRTRSLMRAAITILIVGLLSLGTSFMSSILQPEKAEALDAGIPISQVSETFKEAMSGNILLYSDVLSTNNPCTVKMGDGWTRFYAAPAGGDTILCYGRDDIANGKTISDDLIFFWPKGAYRMNDYKEFGLRLTITSIYVNSIDQTKANEKYGKKTREAFLARNGNNMYFCSGASQTSIKFKLEIIDTNTVSKDSTGKYDVTTGSVVKTPVAWGFTDLDQPDANGKYCSKYNATVSEGKYAEGLILTSNIDNVAVVSNSDGGTINKTVLKDSDGTWVFGKSETDAEDHKLSGCVIHAPKGQFSAEWHGYSCMTGVYARVLGGTMEVIDPPTKEYDTPENGIIAKPGDSVRFIVNQNVPYTPTDFYPREVTFTDTFDDRFDLTNATYTMQRWNIEEEKWENVKNNFDWTIRGQTITATATSAALKGSNGASSVRRAHRMLVRCYLKDQGDGIDWRNYTLGSDGYYHIQNKATTIVKPATGDAFIQDTNTVEVKVKPSNLSIQKRASKFEIKPNESFYYDITVKNIEPGSTATNIRNIDDIPSDFQVTSASVISGSGLVTLNRLGNAVTVSCPTLAYNASFTVRIYATAKDSGNGKVIANEAIIENGWNIPKPGTDSVLFSADHVWVNSPKLSLTKTVDKKEVSVGDKVNYTVTMSSSGAAGTIARNVVLKDQLPKGLAIDMDSIRVNGVPTGTISIPYDSNQATATYQNVNLTSNLTKDANANSFQLALNYLQPSKQITVTYSATALEESNGQYVYNTASVTSDNAENPNPVETDVFVNTPEMEIEKNADKYEYAPGETVTYTVKVKSMPQGTVARQAVIRDEVPSWLTLIPNSVEVDTSNCTLDRFETRVSGTKQVAGTQVPAASHVVRGNIVQVTAPQVAPGEIVIRYKATVNDDAAGQHPVNTAMVTFANIPAGSELDYPKRAMDDIWINDARMKVDKSADKYEYEIGETAHFIVGLHDDIGKTGTFGVNVVLTDEQLPEDFKIDYDSIKVSGVPSPIHWPVDGSGVPRSDTRENNYELAPSENGNGFTLTIPYFPDTASVTVSYDAVAVKEINGLDSLNHATVSDDNPNDPGDETETHIWVNNAQLNIAKSVDEFEYQVGDTAVYELAVTNVKAGTIAKNVSIEDISLPNGAVLVPGSVSVEGVPASVDYFVAGEEQKSQDTEPRDNHISATYADGSECPVTVGSPADGYDGGSAVYADGRNGFNINIDYLPSDNVAVIKYAVHYTEASNGTIVRNTATVSCDNPVPDQDSDELEDSEVVFVNTPDMGITKETTTPEVHVGENAHFIVRVKNVNAGTIAGTPVTVRDQLPDGLIIKEDSVTVSGAPRSIEYPIRGDKSGTSTETRDNAVTALADAASNSLMVTIPYIPSDNEIVIEYDAVAQDSANGTYVENVASVEDPKKPPTTPPDTDTSTVFVNSPELVIGKVADSFEYRVGDIITYNVTVDSIVAGTIARHVNVSDEIPEGFELVENSVKVLSAPAGTSQPEVRENENAYEVSIEEMPFGQAVITYQVKALPGSEGSRYVNHAVLDFGNVPPRDSGDYPKEGKDDIWVNTVKSKVTKSADKFEYEIGETAHFTIGVMNAGAAGTISRNVHVHDSQLPSDFKIDESSIKITGVPETVQYPVDGAGDPREETRDVHYALDFSADGDCFDLTIDYLPASTLVTITYDAVAVKEINGLDALDKVTVDSDIPDDPGDESEVHVWTNSADLTIEKIAGEAEYHIGDDIEYSINIQNIAAGTVAKGIYIADVSLPSYLPIDRESVTVTGVPDKVMYPESAEDGSRIDVERDNSYGISFEGDEGFDEELARASYWNSKYSYSKLMESADDTEASETGTEATGNGFIAYIDYLPAGEVATITFKARVTEDADGKNIENFATTDCENPIIPDPEDPDEPIDPDPSEPGEPVEPDPSDPDEPVDPDDPDGNTPPDPRTPNPKHDTSVIKVNDPESKIVKTSTSKHARLNDVVHYQLTATNEGAGTIARNVVIEDAITPVPESIEHGNIVVNGTYIDEEGAEVTVELEEAEIDATVPGKISIATHADLVSNSNLVLVSNRAESDSGVLNVDEQTRYQSITVEYDIVVKEDMLSSSYTNTAVLIPENDVPTRDEETLDVETNKKGDTLTLYKSSNPASGSFVESGDVIEYTLTAKNTGKDATAFAHIRDYIPDGVELVEVLDGGAYVAGAEPDPDAPADEPVTVSGKVGGDHGNGYVEWVLQDIPSGGSAEVTYRVKVTAVAEEGAELPTYIRNVALYEPVTEDPGIPGQIPPSRIPNRESNEVIHSTDPNHPCPAVIDVEKSSVPEPGSTVFNGDTIHYELTVRNNGGSLAENVGVLDALDSHVELIEQSVTGNGIYSASERSITWNVPELAPGESVVLSLDVTVTGTTPDDVIENSALFEEGWDPESGTTPRNSTNIVEHLSQGDAAVADELIEGDEVPLAQFELLLTGDNFGKMFFLAGLVLSAAGTIILVRERRL